MQNLGELQIGKWGNSLGVRLPKHIVEALQLKAQDTLCCSVENGKLVLKPLRPVKRYTLEELLDEAGSSGEEIAWGAAEGDEAW